MDKVIIDFSEFKNKDRVKEQKPLNPTPCRLIKRRQPVPIVPANGSGSTGGFDPELNEILTSPLLVPILKDYEKVKAQFDPLTREINTLKRYRKNPLFFWRDELGVPIDQWREDTPPKTWKMGDPLPLWSKQREIIEALVKYRKVAVKAGLGTGKTFIAGGLSLYLAYVWHCVGLTTASTFRQVRRALWGEIHYLYNGALNPLGGKLNQVSLDLGDKWFVEGFATDKPMTNITGIHEENIFVIVDEAHGVPDLSFEALEGIVTSENSFVLYIGNAINNSGPFADAFKPNSKFYKVTISCYDLPNVKYNTNIYSKLTSYQWVKDKEIRWGRDSTLFKGWVLGEFPEESKDTLIPIRYIDSALKRGQNGEMLPDRVTAFGLDVARQGSDSSVSGARYASGLFRILEVTNKKRETETAGRMKILYNELAPKVEKVQETYLRLLGKNPEEVKKEEEVYGNPPINVDDIGVGGGVVDMLLEDDFPVNGINVGEGADLYDNDTDHPELFLNKRAQYYWKLRNQFINETIAIDDEELAFELSKIRVEYLRSGKIKIIDKELLRKAPPLGIGRSPDRVECLMLIYAKGTSDMDSEMVRFIG